LKRRRKLTESRGDGDDVATCWTREEKLAAKAKLEALQQETVAKMKMPKSHKTKTPKKDEGEADAEAVKMVPKKKTPPSTVVTEEEVTSHIHQMKPEEIEDMDDVGEIPGSAEDTILTPSDFQAMSRSFLKDGREVLIPTQVRQLKNRHFTGYFLGCSLKTER